MPQRAPNAVIWERKRRAWELVLQGWSQERIAEELGVDQSTVSRYLYDLSKRLASHFEEEIVTVTATHLGQLRYVVDEAMQAWEASKRPEQIVSKKTIPGEVIDEETGQRSPPQEVVTTRVKAQCGDPRFLREAREAMADVREILGIPPKEDKEEYPTLTMEEIQELFDRLPPRAQTAYLRLIELYLGGDDEDSGDEREGPPALEVDGYFT